MVDPAESTRLFNCGRAAVSAVAAVVVVAVIAVAWSVAVDGDTTNADARDVGALAAIDAAIESWRVGREPVSLDSLSRMAGLGGRKTRFLRLACCLARRAVASGGMTDASLD